MVKKFLIVFVALTLPYTSFACQFDTDCAVGSHCVKKSGQLEGYCAKGLSPGNDNDRKPYRDPLDISGKVGNTCSFDTDCGVGNECYKESGSIKGVCIKRR
jgi:hypothetical protein